MEPRKNIAALLDAYADLPADKRSDVRLILTGPAGWGRRDFWSSLIEHPVADEVLLTGHVSEESLATLLGGAEALLAPSHYEGFGLPLLEAMACGTPVICSNAAAFLEVAGGAAEILEPEDITGWREKMAVAIKDESWRQRFAVAGKSCSAQFSWERTADKHAEVIQKIAAGMS